MLAHGKKRIHFGKFESWLLRVHRTWRQRTAMVWCRGTLTDGVKHPCHLCTSKAPAHQVTSAFVRSERVPVWDLRLLWQTVNVIRARLKGRIRRQLLVRRMWVCVERNWVFILNCETWIESDRGAFFVPTCALQQYHLRNSYFFCKFKAQCGTNKKNSIEHT